MDGCDEDTVHMYVYEWCMSMCMCQSYRLQDDGTIAYHGIIVEGFYCRDVAVTRDGNIIVSDCSNHCIRIVDTDGHGVHTIGKHGNGNGEFNTPYGVTMDSRGRLIVADRNNHRIEVVGVYA